MHTYKDYLMQAECPALGAYHSAIFTLGQAVLGADDRVDCDALVRLLKADEMLKGVPGRRLVQADARELRDHIVRKLVEEVSLFGFPDCARQKLWT